MRDTESFSRRTKEELCGNIPRSACCRRAELYGLLLYQRFLTAFFKHGFV